MKTITNRIKELGKKYITPVTIAGALALGSYASANANTSEASLPIYQEVKDSMIAQENREYEEVKNDGLLEAQEKAFHSSLEKSFQHKIQEGKDKTIDSTLNEYNSKYDSLLKSARNKFNEYLAQKDTFTVKEQERVLQDYNSVDSLGKEIIKYAKSNGREKYTPLKLSEQDNRLYSLLNSNINGWDGFWSFKTSLEEELKKEGIAIPVEFDLERRNRDTAKYGFGGGALAIMAFVAGSVLYSMYKSRRKK